MRLKITLKNNPAHEKTVTCVGWSSTEEVYSTSDDNQLLSWTVSNNEFTRIVRYEFDLFPTDLQFVPRVGGMTGGKHTDLMLIASADGRFHMANRGGRIERSVEAHKGAILVGQWSNDGASLLTGGEDGVLKIWSRSGMLRSTVVSSENSVYGASWSPDGQAVVYTNGKLLVIKHLTPNTKPTKWRAHDGLVLCVAWSVACELIASGGEDCKYRVWDSHGRPLFSSGNHDYPIASVAWSPKGDIFAVGSYNTLRLCDYTGWSRCLEKPASGTILKLSWSSDGTQLVGACANGQVLFAHVVDRSVEFGSYTATVTERKAVAVHDVQTDTNELLDLPERVIQLSMRYGFLVLTTPRQCFIYSATNWNTPMSGCRRCQNMQENSSTLQHSTAIVEVALDQAGPVAERRVALLDRNHDLFVVALRATHKAFEKLGGQIESYRWHAEENLLAAVQDTRLIVWYCPTACFDRDLLRLCSVQHDAPELERAPRIHDFVANAVFVRRADGSLLNVPVSPFPALLHACIQGARWPDALALCRTVDEPTLWACLAVLASQATPDVLDIAEEAYAAISQYDKVLYIQHLKELPRALQLAGGALLAGQIHHAESILLHNGMVYNAILNHIRLHNWNRALDLAVRHKTHVDTVLYLRTKYLDALGKDEINDKFINLQQTVEINESKILERIEQEKMKN